MPFVMRAVYEPDGLDDHMLKAGWISGDMAVGAYGVSAGKLRSLSTYGALATRQSGGRDFYALESVKSLVERGLAGPSLSEQLEVLRSQGRSNEALALMNEAHRAYHPEQYEPGYVAPAGSAASEVQNDFGSEFLAKYGR